MVRVGIIPELHVYTSCLHIPVEQWQDYKLHLPLYNSQLHLASFCMCLMVDLHAAHEYFLCSGADLRRKLEKEIKKDNTVCTNTTTTCVSNTTKDAMLIRHNTMIYTKTI